MGSKRPIPPPVQPIRVIIVGDHPWSEQMGWIEHADGESGFLVTRILGTGPDMYKVKMDNGQLCFASANNLRTMDRPTSPPPPRRK